MTHSVGKTHTRYILGLDGVRGLAVIAVIAYHLFPTVVRGGFIGVDIFFVISGFLITTLLVSEHQRSNTIALRQFWLRRARRLLPALMTVICVTSSIALLIGGDVLVGLGRQIVGALTFSSNWTEIAAGSNYFSTHDAHLFSHLWSLAVEEQFYVLWPLIIFGWFRVRRLWHRPKLGVGGCVGLALLSAGLMAVLFDETNITRVYYGTDTHLFGLMIGAALALWRHARLVSPSRRIVVDTFIPRRPLRYRVLPLQIAGILSCAGLVVLLVLLPDQGAITYHGGLLLVSILSAIMIAAFYSYRGLLQRVCMWKPLAWVGVRSYGMYLWHWPLIVLLHYGLSPGTPLWVVPVIVIPSTLLISAISYTYLEVPIQKNGFKTFFWRKRRRVAYPLFAGCIIAATITMIAVVRSPAKTETQMQLEMAQRLLKKPPMPVKSAPITGADVTLIGDSVALASVPALHERFPGILVDAAVSRSLRRGGLETLGAIRAAGNLRKVVVIALGTNGYYGSGNLEALMRQLRGRNVIFVTAYGPDVWVNDNNRYIRRITAKYPNAYIADWRAAIAAHAEKLGPDGIHPTLSGGAIYAQAVAVALAKIHR